MAWRFFLVSCVFCAAVVCMYLTPSASAEIVIETVPVGNIGNAADTRSLDRRRINGQMKTLYWGSVSYAYNIGKYEVTAGQYTAFLNAVGGVDTYALFHTGQSNTAYGSGITRTGSGTIADPYTYAVDNNFVNRPVNYISFGDAVRFANWLHNGQPSGVQDSTTTEDGAYFVNGAVSDAALSAVIRKANWRWAVTSEDEWYKAAYHDPVSVGADAHYNADYWFYPTQSDRPPGRDMTEATNRGNNANYVIPNVATYPIITSPDLYTTLVGEFEHSSSHYGTFDQGGNVYEWTEFTLVMIRGLRGGSLYNDGRTMQSPVYRVFAPPTLGGRDRGFRVVSYQPVDLPTFLRTQQWLSGDGREVTSPPAVSPTTP